MTLEDREETVGDIGEGKIRLSLIDVIYGLVIGYGFNFFVDKDPVGFTPILFLLVILVIVCDWLFVHKPYWKEPQEYSNGPFVLDLCILLIFSCLVRFALRPPHSGVLFAMSAMFLFYALWDVTFGDRLKGRRWRHDFVWDLVAAVAFFLLWKFMDANWMATRVLNADLPNWIGFDIDLRWWILVAFALYGLLGPHKWADWAKSWVRG
jgi:hypothetical protein